MTKRNNVLYSCLMRFEIEVAACIMFSIIIGCSQRNTSTEPGVGQNTAVVYLNSVQQIIRGFGAANIVGWRPDMTTSEIKTAFGNGVGQLGFTIMRVRIPPDSTQFSVDIPSAKLAESLGAIVIATPWTPPAWMKTNGSLVGGSLDSNEYGAYAAHLKAFAGTMAAGGAPVYAVSVQNEPDANVNYESCSWNATEFLNFMKRYAQYIGVPVFMPESFNFNHSLSDAALNDPTAAARIAFIGEHIYGVSPYTYSLALSKGKEIWMTEYLINSGSSTYNSLDTGWSGALQTAKSINDCMMSNMSAYVWWYIVRYYGPIDENGNVTKKGYVMSQYAKFVRPGFYRVNATQNPQYGTYVTAYKSDSKLVIVALNMTSFVVDQSFAIDGRSIKSFTPYVTSISKNCRQEDDIPVLNNTFTFALDSLSVTTFVSS
jgi:glucuronoarabinoxylan endo-1,4-beta-xylanase